MVAENDPTKPILDATQRYQSRLTQLWKVVFKRVDSQVRTLIRFGDMVLAYGEEIVGTVGKAVVDRIANAYVSVKNLLKLIPKTIKALLRLGNKIIALIRKATNPAKILAALKRLFARYARAFRDIFAMIEDFFAQLDILESALAVVNSFSAVLRYVVSWIADVSGAYNAVRKAKATLKSVIKLLKSEIKELIRLQKDVARLKIPA